MKRFISMLVLVTCLCVATSVFALYIPYYYDDTPKSIVVQLNGQNIDFTDENGNKVEPQIINDRTMVPMRKIFEQLGAKVEWNASDRSIKANKDGLEIWLQIDNTTAKVTKNGKTEQITLDAAPTIVDNRTLVPVRFIAESLDKKVGWDSWDRTVVIMDLSFVEDTIKEKASNFYAYITDDYKTLESYEMSFDADIDAKINDNGEKESLGIDAKGDFKFNTEMASLSGKVKLSGKGDSVERSLEDVPDKLEGDMIFDIPNAVLYFRSPLLEEIGELKMDDYSKWIKYALEGEEKEELERIVKEFKEKGNQMSLNDMIDEVLQDDAIDDSTYKELKQAVDLVAVFLSNDFFTVKETRNGKTYTYHLTQNDLPTIVYAMVKDDYTMAEIKEELANELGDTKFDLTIEVVVEDHVAVSSKVSFSLYYKDTYTSWSTGSTSYQILDVTAEIKSKLDNYNQGTTISLPAKKDTVDLKEMLSNNNYGGHLDTAEKAQFSGFATEMGALQDSFKQANITIRGLEIGRGHDVSTEQIYNYLARGANEFGGITQDEEGDQKWLTRIQAKTIPCTPINREYATRYLDMKVRMVETDQGSNQIVSYFVTPKGNVFCWPPYIYNGKSYVTNEITAKTADGKEYGDTDATAIDAKPVITFPNGEVIYISNNSSEKLSPSNVSNANDAFNANEISVIYKARTIDDVTGGTSYGFTFDGYQNGMDK